MAFDKTHDKEYIFCMKPIILTVLFIFAILPLLKETSQAVEVAPRISDREIIEKLAGLEAGQAALDQRFVDLHSEMKAGQAALRSEMKAGQAALRSEMKAGQAALGKRIDDLNVRMSNLQNTMLTIFSAMVALILALFAYIAWDRRTMLKPVVERLDKLERDFSHHLNLQHQKVHV